MAGRRAPSRTAVVQAQTPKVSDPTTQRALDVLSAAVLDLQSRRHLEQFTDEEPGYVPESGGVATDFLAADGVWKTLTGAGLVDDVTAGSSMVSVAPTTGSVVVDVVPANFTGIPYSGITFAGTNNVVVKFSGTTVADSTITDSGVLVTIANALKVTGASDFDSTVNVDGTLTLSTMTQGSVLFAGAGGVVSQDNANLFWDNTNDRLGIGTAAPAGTLEVAGNAWVTGAASQLGVNTATPDTNCKLHVFNTAGGTAALLGTTIVCERNGSNYITIKGPAANDKGILFSNATSNVDGGILYDSPAIPRGLQFRTGGNTTRMSIDSSGNVIVGTSAPGLTKAAFGGPFEVTEDAAAQSIVSAYGTGVGPGFVAFRGRGTAAVTTAVQSGDDIGQLSFTGAQSATAIFAAGIVRAAATENWINGTNVGAKIELLTTTNAAGSAGRAVRLTIDHNGTATFVNAVAATDVIYAYSSLATGYSAIGFRDNSAVLKGATGYGNASVADTAVASRLYWRTLGSDMIFTTGSGTPSTVAMMLFNSTGNVNIGTTVTDPTVKLRVQGSFSTEGNCTIGDAVTDAHTINGSTTLNGSANLEALTVNNTQTAQTVSRAGIRNVMSGTYNTTAGAIITSGVSAVLTSSRSSGANDLTNIALRGSATGGQVNLALRTDSGDVILNNTSGTTTINGATTINSTLSVLGNAAIGNAGSDAHTLLGTVNANSTAGADGEIFQVLGGVPVWGAASSAGIPTGSGTVNTLPKWAPTGTELVDSVVTSSGSTVSVNGLLTVLSGATILSTLDVDGNCTFGNADSDAHTVNGTVTISRTTVANPALATYVVPVAGVSTTIGMLSGVVGTYDTGPGAGALTCVGVEGDCYGSRSAGGNDLINIGVYGYAYNGQQNYAIYGDSSGYSFYGAAGAMYNAGAVTFASTLSVDGNADFNGQLNKFGDQDGEVYFKDDEINFAYANNAAAVGYINYDGYAGSNTQFRSLVIADGKGATVALFTGSDKSTALAGALTVDGNCTLGNADTDAHTLNGRLTLAQGTDAVGINLTGSGGGSAYIRLAGGSDEILQLGSQSGVTKVGIGPTAISGTGELELTTTVAAFTVPLTVSNTTATISSGTGTPEGAVTAPVGSLFLRTDNANSFYVKQTGAGNTGWILK